MKPETTLYAMLTCAVLLIETAGTSSVYQGIYRRVLNCAGGFGCPLDQPNKSMIEIPNVLRCAIYCSLKRNCSTFTYMEEKRLCLIFDKRPYMISDQFSCTSFDGDAKNDRRSAGDNLSVYKRSCQSSTSIVANRRLESWLALDNLFGTSIQSGHCSGTNKNDSYENWLMVDLVDFMTIIYVRILAKDTRLIGVARRYQNLTIGLTNKSWLVSPPIRNKYPLCGVYLGPLVNATWFRVNCTPSVPSTRFAIVHQTRIFSTDGGYLSLCEFQVYGNY